MPYIPEREAPYAKMTRLLKGYGLDGTGLASLLGCSAPTGLKKLREPERLTLGDLAKIHARGHIPMDELRGAIIR